MEQIIYGPPVPEEEEKKDEVPTRTRQDDLAIANNIFKQLYADPVKFRAGSEEGPLSRQGR